MTEQDPQGPVAPVVELPPTPVELTPTPPPATPDDFRSDIQPPPAPTPQPEPLVFRTWEEAGSPVVVKLNGEVLRRGWPAKARQPGSRFIAIRPGQQLINPSRRQKKKYRRTLPVTRVERGKDGKWHRKQTKIGLSGRQWRDTWKGLRRAIKRHQETPPDA